MKSKRCASWSGMVSRSFAAMRNAIPHHVTYLHPTTQSFYGSDGFSCSYEWLKPSLHHVLRDRILHDQIWDSKLCLVNCTVAIGLLIWELQPELDASIQAYPGLDGGGEIAIHDHVG